MVRNVLERGSGSLSISFFSACIYFFPIKLPCWSTTTESSPQESNPGSCSILTTSSPVHLSCSCQDYAPPPNPPPSSAKAISCSLTKAVDSSAAPSNSPVLCSCQRATLGTFPSRSRHLFQTRTASHLSSNASPDIEQQFTKSFDTINYLTASRHSFSSCPSVD